MMMRVSLQHKLLNKSTTWFGMPGLNKTCGSEGIKTFNHWLVSRYLRQSKQGIGQRERLKLFGGEREDSVKPKQWQRVRSSDEGC